MSKYGLTVRYYPPDIIGMQERIVVEVTEWDARRPTLLHENIMAEVSIIDHDDLDPNDPDWMIIVLTETLELIEARKAERDRGFISGANGHGDLASENSSPKM